MLTKIDTRVDSTGKDSGDTEALLKTSRVATGKLSYQTRESPHSSSALSLPHCRFPMYCCCIRRCLPGKPWSVTCGLRPVDCLLLWHVLCFTNLCALSTRNRPDAHSLRYSVSGTRLCLGAGLHPPTPSAPLAHGRTPNQHCSHDCSSCSSTSS